MQKSKHFFFIKESLFRLKNFAKSFAVSEEEVKTAVSTLTEKLSGRGISLVINEREVMLGTAPQLIGFFRRAKKRRTKQRAFESFA
jgi:chromosome segregation and condensation protein ScpB